MARLARLLLRRSTVLVALLQLSAFVPLTSGLAALVEPDGDCDCSTRHEDGDDEDQCPPFCGSCLDCAGCFDVHAVVTALPTALPIRAPAIVRVARPVSAASPPDAPLDEPVHVPLRVG